MTNEKSDWPGTAYEIAIAAGAGAATGGPVGAGVGAAAAAIKRTIDRVREDSFGGTALARLQEDRLTEAIREASRTIESMMMLGHVPREDWFDTDDEAVRSSFPGIELLEGTMIAAANEFERRKVKLVANLWSQLAFNPSVDFETSVLLLKAANELSYHQLAIVAALTEISGPPPTAEQAELDLAVANGPVVLPNTGHDSDRQFEGSTTTAMHVYDLVRRDIVRQERGNQVPFNIMQIRPWRCSPTLVGRRLYILTAMRTHVPIEEKMKLAAELVKHG
jgi:hypothetical protein